MTRNAIKMLYCEKKKMLYYGQQNFMFAIHYFSKSSPAFPYCNHRPNAFMEKKTDSVARDMQQEHIQWQRKQDQILHMRQQAGGGQRFSRKKAARAGAQRLSPAGRMTWWEKGRKWWCHYSAQWQNDIQEKTIMEPGRTKIQLCKQTQHRQSYISKIFSKSPRIYLRVFSDFVILSIHAYLWDECFFTTYFEQTCPPLYSQGKTQWVIGVVQPLLTKPCASFLWPAEPRTLVPV